MAGFVTNAGLDFATVPSGTPVAGALAGTTSAQALGASLACKGVFIFQAAGDQDTMIGDATSQPAPVPSVPFFLLTDNVNKVYAKLTANTATIPWIAIT